jgi:hypothetical protein
MAGVIGRGNTITPSNCYCLVSNNAAYYTANNLGNYSYTGRVKDKDELKRYTVKLGTSFAYDVYNKNAGWPVLAWQNQTREMELNKNHTYIKVRRNFKPKCNRKNRNNRDNWRKL